jgi:hypothetical protein
MAAADGARRSRVPAGEAATRDAPPGVSPAAPESPCLGRAPARAGPLGAKPTRRPRRCLEHAAWRAVEDSGVADASEEGDLRDEDDGSPG